MDIVFVFTIYGLHHIVFVFTGPQCRLGRRVHARHLCYALHLDWIHVPYYLLL